MHDYLFSTEVVRFAFVAGVVVSMLIYERYHLTTGSIVVPGYVALFLPVPTVIAATIVNAAISYVMVNRVLPRWFLLYGRTKFTIQILISISIQAAMLRWTPSGPWLWEADMPLFVGVGYVVPALIAHDMARQGIGKTAKSVSVAAALVAAPICLAFMLHAPYLRTGVSLGHLTATRLDATWMPLAVLLSASAAWAVATNYALRSGGFVGAALMAVFAVNIWQILTIVGVALITHQVVTRVLMHRMILFGRRKFAAMLLCAASVVWTLVWVGQHLLSVPTQQHFGLLSLALTPLFLPGLMANDMERSSPARLLLGMSVSSVFVLCTSRTLQAMAHGQPPARVTGGLAVITFAAIFLPQLQRVGGVLSAAIAPRLARGWEHTRRGMQSGFGPIVMVLDGVTALVLPDLQRPEPLYLAETPEEPTRWSQASTRRRRPSHASPHEGGLSRPGPALHRPRHLATDESRATELQVASS